MFIDAEKSERKIRKEFMKARTAGKGSSLAGSRDQGRAEGGRGSPLNSCSAWGRPLAKS